MGLGLTAILLPPAPRILDKTHHAWLAVHPWQFTPPLSVCFSPHLMDMKYHLFLHCCKSEILDRWCLVIHIVLMWPSGSHCRWLSSPGHMRRIPHPSFSPAPHLELFLFLVLLLTGPAESWTSHFLRCCTGGVRHRGFGAYRGEATV